MNLLNRALNEDSNQSAHLRILIRVFVVRIKKVGILCYPKRAQWRFWSDCANAQSDLNLRWAHMSEGTFSDDEVRIFIVGNTNHKCLVFVEDFVSFDQGSSCLVSELSVIEWIYCPFDITRKDVFAWRFILNENVLFWLTTSYQKSFVFSVSVFRSQIYN